MGININELLFAKTPKHSIFGISGRGTKLKKNLPDKCGFRKAGSCGAHFKSKNGFRMHRENECTKEGDVCRK